MGFSQVLFGLVLLYGLQAGVCQGRIATVAAWNETTEFDTTEIELVGRTTDNPPDNNRDLLTIVIAVVVIAVTIAVTVGVTLLVVKLCCYRNRVMCPSPCCICSYPPPELPAGPPSAADLGPVKSDKEPDKTKDKKPQATDPPYENKAMIGTDGRARPNTYDDPAHQEPYSHLPEMKSPPKTGEQQNAEAGVHVHSIYVEEMDPVYSNQETKHVETDQEEYIEMGRVDTARVTHEQSSDDQELYVNEGAYKEQVQKSFKTKGQGQGQSFSAPQVQGHDQGQAEGHIQGQAEGNVQGQVEGHAQGHSVTQKRQSATVHGSNRSSRTSQESARQKYLSGKFENEEVITLYLKGEIVDESALQAGINESSTPKDGGHSDAGSSKAGDKPNLLVKPKTVVKPKTFEKLKTIEKPTTFAKPNVIPKKSSSKRSIAQSGHFANQYVIDLHHLTESIDIYSPTDTPSPTSGDLTPALTPAGKPETHRNKGVASSGTFGQEEAGETGNVAASDTDSENIYLGPDEVRNMTKGDNTGRGKVNPVLEEEDELYENWQSRPVPSVKR